MIAPVQPRPQLKVGQLVQHRRYGYRGVIVDYDLRCRAPDEWYESNQTQPDRNQPWYHVLVHGSDAVTYAAESNLTDDNSGQPIDHPLIDAFFSSFSGEHYVRNDTPMNAW